MTKYMENPVIIFGANTLGKAVAEIFESNDVIVYGFLDDNTALHGDTLGTLPILGGTEDDSFLELIGQKCEAFVAIDDAAIRKSIIVLLKERMKKIPVNAIHSNTEIAVSAHIGHGIFANSGVIIGSNARLGDHCMLNSNAVIDYSAKLEDMVRVGAGAVIGAEAEVGSEVFIGAGATVVPGVKIAKNARIGAGSVVIADVEEGKTVFGNPAKPYQP